MLLGSPPDMVHGPALRETRPSSPLTAVRQHIEYPGAGVHPRCSGLRVQGTAGSPTSTVPRLLYAMEGFFARGTLQIQDLCYNAFAPPGRSAAALPPVPSRSGRTTQKQQTRGRSSAGRAFGSHPRGRGFESLRLHQTGLIFQACFSMSGLLPEGSCRLWQRS